MNIDECISRFEKYGYAVNVSPLPCRIYMDGYGLRLGLTAVDGGTVVGIDCYLKRDGKIDTLLGTTDVYPKFTVPEWTGGIGIDEMFSVLSEPRKAAMRFRAMKLEEDLRVLEG
jgi:hypothetical protein